MTRRARTLVIAGVLFAIAAVAFALGFFTLCRQPDDEREAVSASEPSADWPPPPSDYVGSQSCRECHSAIAELYATHPMSRSLAPAGLARAGEDYSQPGVVETGPGRRLVVERTTDGGIRHHEQQSRPDGELLYDAVETIDYSVGSGTRGCSYLLNRDGALFISPVTWYTQGRTWDLSPGYEPPLYPRFERQASEGCLACHAGRMNLASPPRVDRFNADQPFFEESIGCERCHGPGGRHVQYHREPQRPGEADPIVNPAKLAPARRDAVCWQCHLQGRERVVRAGRSQFDFRPGMALSDIWVTFLKTADVEGGAAAAVSQVEQMLASRCYSGSDGALGCISCHDPHQAPVEDQQVDFYRERCLACHTAPQPECGLPKEQRLDQSAQDACTDCHMPRLSASDVPHTAQTDHRVVRFADGAQRPATQVDVAGSARPEASLAPTDLERRQQQFGRLFVEPGVELPEEERHRAWAVFLGNAAESARNGEMASAAIASWRRGARRFDDARLQAAVGKSYDLLGDTNSAFAIWREGLEASPEDPQLLHYMATTLHQANEPAAAAEHYERLIQVKPHCPTLLGRLAHAHGQAGQFREGIAAARRALEFNPGLIQAHQWLDEVYTILGERDRALEHRRMAEELQSVQSAPAPSAALPD